MPNDNGHGWQHLQADIYSGNIRRGGNWSYGPVKLSWHDSRWGIVNVDDVSFKTFDRRAGR